MDTGPCTQDMDTKTINAINHQIDLESKMASLLRGILAVNGLADVTALFAGFSFLHEPILQFIYERLPQVVQSAVNQPTGIEVHPFSIQMVFSFQYSVSNMLFKS